MPSTMPVTPSPVSARTKGLSPLPLGEHPWGIRRARAGGKKSYLILTLISLFLLSACAGHNHAPVRDLEKPKKVNWGSHSVKKGETLYSIAWRYGRDYRELATINGISKPYLLKPGQIIRLHPVKTYRKPSAKKSKPVKPTNTASRSQPVKVAAPGPVQWRWPLQGKLVGTFSSSSNSGSNKGIDIAAAKGASVQAAAAGTVVYAGNGLIGYGLSLIHI